MKGDGEDIRLPKTAPFRPPFPNFFLPPPPIPNYPYFQRPAPYLPPQPRPVVNYKQNFDFNDFVRRRNELLERFQELMHAEDGSTVNDAVTETSQMESNSSEAKINICFYQEGAFKLEKILAEIKAQFEKLKSENKENADEIKARLEELRKQYEELSSVLNNERNLKILQSKIKKQKSKRRREYKKRLKKRYDEAMKQNAIEQKHMEIDNNLKILNEKIQQEKEKQAAKKLVDETLHQVNKKLSDTKGMLEYCTKLRKLRQIRRQHARDRSTFPKESDPNEENFESSLKEIETIVLNQIAIYENEKANLMLKLNVEKERRKKRENELNKEKFEIELKKHEKQIKEILFGFSNDQAASIENDSLYLPSRQFHNQSESSLESLFYIRQQWDQYLAPSGTPGATNVPLEWVYPSEPSDSNWAKYLIQTCK